MPTVFKGGNIRITNANLAIKFRDKERVLSEVQKDPAGLKANVVQRGRPGEDMVNEKIKSKAVSYKKKITV